VRSIIYNYQGGAGGEGYVARKHGLPHTIDKNGKFRLSNEKHNLPKRFIQEGRLFQGLMDVDQGIYLTHHLYFLNQEELLALSKKFEIITIDSTAHKEEIFLMRLFKDYVRRIDSPLIPLILNYEITLIQNTKLGCLLDYLDYGDWIPNKIERILAEYASHDGMFYNDNIHWHSNISRIPGSKVEYIKKPSLGQLYLHGQYWNLNDLLRKLKNE
jgi:hypothetical protein